MKMRFVTVLFVLVCSSLTADAWQPAAPRLLTPWAGDVDPDKPYPEYPRPQMVRADWVNLNGLWRYAIKEAGLEFGPWVKNGSGWDGEILVPYAVESSLSGVARKMTKEQALWYRREFSAPERERGERVLLHFGAVDWHTKVWVNGQIIGEHKGGYDPFTFDVTDVLKGNGSQELVLRVWDPTNDGWQPRGKQVKNPKGIMYTAVSGIWQTAWLETVPSTYIESLHLVPYPDREELQVTVYLSGAHKQGTVEIVALEGKKPISEVSGSAGEKLALKVKDAKLWSPDHPHLYDLVITTKAQGVEDEVSSYFGMRKIDVRKDDGGINRLFLNDEPLFQIGPLDQGWWPDGLYTAATDEALRFDVEMTRKMGFNMARKHVKVEHARWYYWCDKLGLMVWQDMASGGSQKNEESRANFRTELKAMVDTFRNHPSIVMWVPFNEGWGQHDTEAIVDWLKDYDPSRLVNNASGWTDKGVGDVLDIHRYPGPGMPKLEPDRAAVLGEFGGLGLVLPGHLWQEDKNWGYRSFKDKAELEENYERLMYNLNPLIGKGLAAAVYTQTSDVEIEVNGLMTYDRKVIKIPAERLAEMHAKLYEPPPIIKTLVESAENGDVVWRYTTDKPADQWFEPDFRDDGWNEGKGGFGRNGTPGAILGTEWKTSDIWIRRSFELNEDPKDPHLSLHHDEDAVVYINGAEVGRVTGYTTAYTMLPIKNKSVLKKGTNTMAVHCRQTTGGQYIDVGIVDLIERN